MQVHVTCKVARFLHTPIVGMVYAYINIRVQPGVPLKNFCVIRTNFLAICCYTCDNIYVAIRATIKVVKKRRSNKNEQKTNSYGEVDGTSTGI